MTKKLRLMVVITLFTAATFFTAFAPVAEGVQACWPQCCQNPPC